MARRPARTAAVVAGMAGLVILSAGGGAVANTLITSSAQIKNGVVTGADLKDGTVRSVDVGDGSLTGTDIKNGSIRSGDVAGGYYTRAEVDAKFQMSGAINVPGVAFNVGGEAVVGLPNCVRLESGTQLLASLPLPTGITITGFAGRFLDDSDSASGLVKLTKSELIGFTELAAAVTGLTTTGFVGYEQVGLVTPEVVGPQENFFLTYVPSAAGAAANQQICGVSIFYETPPATP